jgi:membrane fusion protein (multidrug efflux system)
MNQMPTTPGAVTRAFSSLCVAAALLLLSACADNPVPGAPGGGRPGGPGGPGAAPLAVTTALPTRELLGAEIEAVGTALANETVEITAKVSNRIEAIHFTEGQRVAKGAVLVQLDRAQAAAEVAEAEANLAEAQRQLRRGQDLELTQALSRAQLDQLQTAVATAEARVAAARARLDDTVIRAPFAGRTGFRRVSVGGFVNAGTVITTLDDTSIIKLEFNVPQSFLGELAVGLPVTARVEGLADRVFEGRLTTLGSRLDPVTRSIAVRAELPNADDVLKPGMFMSVTLRGRTTPTLVLPEQAIVPEEGRNYVFVVKEGRAVRREVTTGLRRPGRVAIVAGLEDSERVIIDGTFRARDGAPVVEAGAQAGEGGSGAARS